MNEMRDDGGRAQGARGCGRSQDLVAYLYGEARPAEAGAFRAHLDECAVCREELTVFGGVRESVALFRAEVDGHARPLELSGVLQAGAAPEAEAAPGVAASARFVAGSPARQRSALTALREFFRLSPLWLRAGAATAVVVFCALAALTLARGGVRWDDKGFALVSTPDGREVTTAGTENAPAVYTREQVEAIVAERVAGEVAAARGRWEEGAKQSAVAENKRPSVAGGGGNPKAKPERVVEAAAKAGEARRRTPSVRHTRRPELVAEEEDDLPRLSDLLGGAYD